MPSQLIPADSQSVAPEIDTSEIDAKITELEEKLDEVTGEQEEDKINYNLGTLYLKKGDLEKATEFLNEVSTNPHPEIFKRTMHNLSTIELQQAIQTLSADPDKSIESLDQAEYYLKQALTAAKGDKETITKIQNNIKSLFKYKETAKLSQKVCRSCQKIKRRNG